MTRCMVAVLMIIAWALPSVVTAETPATLNVGVFDSVNVDQPAAMEHLELLAQGLPGTEVINYSWQWGTQQDRQSYANQAERLGLTVDPPIFDYALEPLEGNQGLRFVQEAKQWPSIKRYFIFDEFIPTLPEDEKQAMAELDPTVVSKYLPQLQAYNAAIHKLDPDRFTWGVVQCYPGQDQSDDLAIRIAQLTTPDPATGFAAMDMVGCDAYTANTGDIDIIQRGIIGLEQVPDLGSAMPFVIQANDLTNGHGRPTKAYLSAVVALIRQSPDLQLWIYDPLGFTTGKSFSPQDQQQWSVIQSVLGEAP